MTLDSTLHSLLPVLVPIVAGLAVSAFAGVRMESLVALLRSVFFPALLFTVLRDGIQLETFLLVAGIGAAMAAIGVLVARNSHRFLKPRVDPSAASLNVACFMVPFLALGWASRGLAPACALFVGATVVTLVVESRGNPRSLLSAPWVYAIVAFFLCQRATSAGAEIEVVLKPIAQATYPLLLVVLGASLHPLVSMKDANAWATVCVRLVSGIGVAVLAIAVLPLSRLVAEGIFLTALAPPATPSMILCGAGKDTEPSRVAAALGTLVSLAAIITLMLTGWSPWRL